jgi:hypothetical protein
MSVSCPVSVSVLHRWKVKAKKKNIPRPLFVPDLPNWSRAFSYVFFLLHWFSIFLPWFIFTLFLVDFSFSVSYCSALFFSRYYFHSFYIPFHNSNLLQLGFKIFELERSLLWNWMFCDNWIVCVTNFLILTYGLNNTKLFVIRFVTYGFLYIIIHTYMFLILFVSFIFIIIKLNLSLKTLPASNWVFPMDTTKGKLPHGKEPAEPFKGNSTNPSFFFSYPRPLLVSYILINTIHRWSW